MAFGYDLNIELISNIDNNHSISLIVLSPNRLECLLNTTELHGKTLKLTEYIYIIS